MLNQEVVTFSGDTATARLDIQVTTMIILLFLSDFLIIKHNTWAMETKQCIMFLERNILKKIMCISLYYITKRAGVKKNVINSKQ